MSLEYIQEEVMRAGLCTACGACAAACPRRSLEPGPDGPRCVGGCVECGLCFAACPRASPPPEPPGGPLGPVLCAFSARARDHAVRGQAQDGGVVSALAARAIASGSCVVAVGRDSWRAVPRLFSSSPPPGGSVYSRVPLLHLLASADGPFLLVGLPCHARGARSLAALPTFRGRVGLVVGLFCSRAFDHEGLWALLRGRGADPSRVERMAIKRGTLVASGPGTVEVGVRELAPAALPCFERCDDFAARFSDVSVGSVDSPDGWSTVIARTEAGREALQACIDGGLVEGVPLAELPTTTRLAEAKARHAADKRQGQPSP